MKILIVYTNQADPKLQRCIESLEKTAPQIERILRQADTKKTKVAEEIYEEVLNEEEEDIMIWHPDMIAVEGWYEELMKYYEMFDLIGCKLVYPNGVIQHYGGGILPDARGCHPHQYQLDIGLTKPLDVAYVTGPGMVIKQRVWKKCKFDFNYTYYIDADFCIQARKEGFTVGVVPIKIVHEEGQETLKLSREEIAQKQAKSHQYFLAKWMSYLGEITE